MAETETAGTLPTYRPRARYPLLSAVWLLSILLLFVLMVALMYYFQRPAPGTGEKTPAQKAEFYKEWSAKEAAAAHGKPDWVDKAKGLVRIPVEQSMAILAREAAENNGRIKPLRRAAEPTPPAEKK